MEEWNNGTMRWDQRSTPLFHYSNIPVCHSIIPVFQHSPLHHDSLPSPPVFVVDDDASIRKALTRLIKSAGYRVNTFASAGEFLEGIGKA